MHLWETINGRNLYTTIDWVPYVYVKKNNGDIKTIDGFTSIKKDFIDYRDYYEFCKYNDKNIYENKVKPEVQFLAERYHKIPDESIEVPNLLIYTIDIEINFQDKFPSPELAEEPICLISIKNNLSKETITFGEKKYNNNKCDYRHYEKEEVLLKNFLLWINNNPPDVITGWNISGFDIPYIINRIKKLFGESTNIYNYLSPIKIVRTWKSKRDNRTIVDIAGVTILDYMEIYKWYTPKNLESYSLDFVSKEELEKGKLDYSEYNDLRDLYKNNWDKYVDYNVVDCERVFELENKLGYIRLIQSLSLLTKCPMKYYDAMTQLIEGAMLTYYRRNNLCAPYLLGGSQEHFPAAYVKEPIPGMYEWVSDLDITSSYPSHIITLNMSNETFIGRILDMKESIIVLNTKNRKFTPFNMYKEGRGKVTFEGIKLDSFNESLKRGLIAIAPCGSIFSTKTPGVLSTVEKEIFNKRIEVKNQMKDIRNNILPTLEKSSLEYYVKENKAKELFSLQWAIKILINAMFGIMAVPYSRYFNTDMAEAVTSCGRHTILKGQDFANDYIKTVGVFHENLPDDIVSYIDTDSLFLRLGDYLKIIDENWENYTDNEKIEIIINESKKIERYINSRVFEEVQLGDYNSQVKDFKIKFKQEIVAKTALFIKKKKYAYWVVNEEGTPCDELAVKGLEVVRSDSSEAVRTRLKKVMEMIMKGASDDELSKIISDYKNELKNVLPEEIAANIGINNIDKYIIDNKSTKGTPWHVKGVANYRMLLKKFNLENVYEDIHDGTKCKVVYIKQNSFEIETITFKRWPKEFEKFCEVDYEKMIDKFFIKKIGFLLEPMNKMNILSSKKINNMLNIFFN